MPTGEVADRSKKAYEASMNGPSSISSAASKLAVTSSQFAASTDDYSAEQFAEAWNKMIETCESAGFKDPSKLEGTN